MNKPLFVTACALISVAIILGAFGAHALQAKLESAQLLSFETGVRYHIYHAIALLIIAFCYEKLNPKRAVTAIRLMMTGLFFFSGSIYLFTVGHLMAISFSSWLWWTTPLGGFMLIISWLLVARAAFNSK